MNFTCQCIKQVNEIKYLGLYLDSKIHCKTHINYVQNKFVSYVRIFLV